MNYCTKFGMVQFRSDYNGVDTMNVTTDSDFRKPLEIIF